MNTKKFNDKYIDMFRLLMPLNFMLFRTYEPTNLRRITGVLGVCNWFLRKHVLARNHLFLVKTMK